MFYYYNKDWNFENSPYLILYTSTYEHSDHLILYSNVEKMNEHIGSGSYRIVATQPIERYFLSKDDMANLQIRLK